jgi:hypothetical protein
VGIKEPGSEAAWVPQANDFHVDLRKFFMSGDFAFVTFLCIDDKEK